MHILLTDVLACPRCGPEFGLIVLADEMDGREVMEGRLGCMNCREEYPVRGGVADLRVHRPAMDVGEGSGAPEGRGRAGARDSGAEAAPDGGMHDPAYRAAALLGVGHGPGTVLVLGAGVDTVDRIAELLPNAQVVGGRPDAGAAARGWILHGDRLPFRDRSLRGVAVFGDADRGVAAEALRALAPGARVVLDPASSGTRDLLEEWPVTMLLDQDGVVVASTPTGR